MTLSSLSAPLALLLSALLVTSPVRAQLASPAPDASLSDLQIRIAAESSLAAAPGSRQSSPISLQVLDSAGSPVADAAVAIRLPDTDPSGTFSDGSHSLVAYTNARGEAQITGIQWGQTAGSVIIRVTATKGPNHAGTLFEERLGASEAASVSGPALPVPAPLPVSAHLPAGQLAAVPALPAAPAPAVSVETVGRRLTPGAYPASGDTSISVTNFRSGDLNEPSFHSSHLKWIILAAVVAAGAGTAVALMNRGKSSSSSSSSITVGAPTVSVGAP